MEQQNQQSQSQNDDDEALSLSDLATNDHHNPEQNHSQQRLNNELPEADFAFGGSSQLENNMCSADELFFRGQILPLRLRHSVTLPSRFTTRTEDLLLNRSISVSRAEPVSVASSTRSSTSVSEFHGYDTTSPTPQIRTRSLRRDSNKSPSKWGFLRLDPIKVQEFRLSDLRNRSQRSHGRSSNNDDEEKKQQQILMSFPGCKCSAGADVVESTVLSRISRVKPTTLNEEEDGTGYCVWKESNVGRRKHVGSSNRTSEWLKQLFVQKNDFV